LDLDEMTVDANDDMNGSIAMTCFDPAVDCLGAGKHLRQRLGDPILCITVGQH
jgi:hypothetical protein